jgi:hypothetical protein
VPHGRPANLRFKVLVVYAAEWKHLYDCGILYICENFE